MKNILRLFDFRAMKKNVVFLLVSIFLNTLNAQEIKLKNFYIIDSLKIEELDEYERVFIDSVLTLYHKENIDSNKIKYLDELVAGLEEYTYKDYWIEFNEILNIENERVFKGGLKYKYYKGVYYYNLSIYQIGIGDSQNALISLESAASYFESTSDQEYLANIYQNLGIIYKFNLEMDKAFKNFEKALKLWEASENYYGLSVTYTALGIILTNEKLYDEAEKYFTLAIESVLKGEGYEYYMSDIYSQKAILEQKKGNYQLALAYCDSALACTEKYNPTLESKLTIANTNIHQGKIYSENLKDNKKALKYYKNAFKIADKFKHYRILMSSINEIGLIYLEMDNLQQAQEYANKATSLLDKRFDLELTKITYNFLQKVEEKKGNYKKALEINGKYNAVKDSLLQEREKADILKNSVRYQYEKQKAVDSVANAQKLILAEKNTIIAEKEAKRAEMINVSLFVFGVILFGLLFFIYSRMKLISNQKKKLDEAYLQLDKSKKNELAVSNLKILQSQMNPHFIFNSLNSVQDLVLLKDIRNSNKYLGQFSDLIRKILISSRKQFISLLDEIEILKLYLNLEKLRFGDDFEVDFSCDIPKEKIEELKMPAMFIQPCIENAIKHGLFHKQGVKKLKIEFSINENKLKCIVEDNGIGRDNASKIKKKHPYLHTGFSTEAIYERIALLNQTMERKMEFTVEDLFEKEKPSGTKITLLFQI